MTRKEEIKIIAFETASNEHPIAEYESFIRGATWADKTMLDKVCHYLYHRLENGKKLTSDLIDDMRKVMEE